MPTLLTHPVVPVAIGVVLGQRWVSPRLLAAGVVAALLPDADVLGFKFGIAYASAFGHRGATHSVAFALLLAGLAAALWRPLQARSAMLAALFVFAATLSHPLLDMLTTGGEGVALWWPYSAERHFADWRPIAVSPFKLQQLWGERGWRVLRSEAMCVWAPALGLMVCAGALRRWRR
jgi:inner membrane protein